MVELSKDWHTGISWCDQKDGIVLDGSFDDVEVGKEAF